MIRKVRFPLKYKFVTAISILLLLTMSFYLSYALNVFKEDKAADVYSIALTNSVSVAERSKLLFNETFNLMDRLREKAQDGSLQNTLDQFFLSEPVALGIECLRDNRDHFFSINQAQLESLNPEIISKSFSPDNESIFLLKNLPLRSSRAEIGRKSALPSHYTILKSIDDHLKCAVYMSYDKLMPLMNETLNYGTYLLTSSGKVFFKLDNFTTNIDAINIVNDSTVLSVEQGVKRFVQNNQAIIRAFSKIGPLGLIAVTEIAEDKAFLASEFLIQKSIYFGLLILSIAVIVGILFTKRMTKNVQTLFEATTLLSKGDFNVSPVAYGNDEIGALTDSFVDMKDKIVMFMEEMKEKARLEGELKLAKLVQDSFFPKHSVVKSTFSFDGRYIPASECSGDWWGYFEQSDCVTIIVCDATGHGVPAALITAAAHSCISTLKIDSEKSYVSPKAVLDKLNKVICSMNSDILMTAFVLEINEAKGAITYSNASHMTPYLARIEGGNYQKSGIVPLMDNNGARLGERPQSQYSENTLPIYSGDRLIMYSDGLLEMLADNKAWGQRNFLKAFLNSCSKEAGELVKNILEEFNQHCKGEHPQDDITLVGVSFESARLISQIEDIQKHQYQGSYVISKLSNEENLSYLINNKNINHLIGHNTIDLSLETKLVEILEKKSTFTLADYISEEFRAYSWNLKSNLEIGQTIISMAEKCEEELKLDQSEAIKIDILKLVSEELLSNSFYHSKGQETNYPRGQQITLPTDQSIEYFFAISTEAVIISVKGPSTIGPKEKILNSIMRGYLDKTPLESTGGAGLGLYIVYQNSNQFWAIDGSKSSQIICVFEKFNRYKKAKERITSFHYLAKEIEND